MKVKASTDRGYSIIELVVVLAGLSILASFSLIGVDGKGGILGAVKIAEIDEAKALLNKAAADCLQKWRLGGEKKDIIDAEIISDTRIKPIGFEINKSDKADKCSYFQLIPISEDDNIRYPIGFSVIDGSLSKFATPTSSNANSIKSCQRWAGVNCKQDECLKKLVEWKTTIDAEKNACEAKYSKWLTEGNTQPPMFTRWNPNADAGCPSKPSSDCTESYISSTCTTNGCNREVWGLDGKFVGYTRKDYELAIEDKYGKACTEWIANKKENKYTNNPSTQPVQLKECGSQEFWFYKGVDFGSKEEFDKRICSDNLEKEKSEPGKRTVQGCGEKIYYFCNNKIIDSEKDFKQCSCDVEKYNKAQEGVSGSFSTAEKGAVGCGDYWICKDEIINDEASFNNKCKEALKPKDCGEIPHPACDLKNYYRHGMCIEYNECKGRV